jgi:hypothetical protein
MSFDFSDDDDDDYGQLEFTYGDEEHPPSNTDNPSGAAAVLTLIPTSTTNPRRPRTLAAGWDKSTRTLTVVFRPDGERPAMVWNYYEVDGLLWNNFAKAVSKGAFIYTYLDPRGPQLMGEASGTGATAQAILNYASSTQHKQTGVQTGQGVGHFTQSPNARQRKNAVSYVKSKQAGVPSKWKSVADALGYKTGNLGGTGRTRTQKADLNDAVDSFYRNKRS